MDNGSFFVLDVFNDDIYPQSPFTKERVDISVPLHGNCPGENYLEALDGALGKLSGDFRVAFVVAGTDVLSTDPIGGLRLSVEDIAKRDEVILRKLKELSIPSIFLGGGGYSKGSALSMSESISNLYKDF